MVTIVTLVSPVDTLSLYPTPDVNGYVYDNATLNEWYALAGSDVRLDKRPNFPGMYSPGQVFTEEAKPILVGQYYGANAADALNARRRLARFRNNGNSITMTVTDELGPTSREVWLIALDAPFRYGFDHVPFDIAFVAPDSRRYAGSVTDEEGMPSAGSGLVWNLGTAGSGLYFDWGTAGTEGRVQFTNDGATATAPRIEVGGNGGLSAGFRVTEVETGREVTFERATSTGETVVLNSKIGQATLNGADVTIALTKRQWFSIPAGATRRYQITPLGTVTGSPTIKLTAANAYD